MPIVLHSTNEGVALPRRTCAPVYYRIEGTLESAVAYEHR